MKKIALALVCVSALAAAPVSAQDGATSGPIGSLDGVAGAAGLFVLVGLLGALASGGGDSPPSTN